MYQVECGWYIDKREYYSNILEVELFEIEDKTGYSPDEFFAQSKSEQQRLIENTARGLIEDDPDPNFPDDSETLEVEVESTELLDEFTDSPVPKCSLCQAKLPHKVCITD